MLTFVIGGIGYFGTGHSDIGYLGDLWATDRASDIEELPYEGTFAISPNPAEEIVKIVRTAESGEFIIEFYDNSGRKIMEQQSATIETEINISSLATGVYYVKLLTNESVFVKKLIKE
jgi:hypothetical protein